MFFLQKKKKKLALKSKFLDSEKTSWRIVLSYQPQMYLICDSNERKGHRTGTIEGLIWTGTKLGCPCGSFWGSTYITLILQTCLFSHSSFPSFIFFPILPLPLIVDWMCTSTSNSHWHSNSQYGNIWRWDFWEIIRSWVWTMNGIRALLKEPTLLPLFHPVRIYNEKTEVCELHDVLPQKTQAHWQVDLRL